MFSGHMIFRCKLTNTARGGKSAAKLACSASPQSCSCPPASPVFFLFHLHGKSGRSDVAAQRATEERRSSAKTSFLPLLPISEAEVQQGDTLLQLRLSWHSVRARLCDRKSLYSPFCHRVGASWPYPQAGGARGESRVTAEQTSETASQKLRYGCTAYTEVDSVASN